MLRVLGCRIAVARASHTGTTEGPLPSDVALTRGQARYNPTSNHSKLALIHALLRSGRQICVGFVEVGFERVLSNFNTQSMSCVRDCAPWFSSLHSSMRGL